MSDDAPSMPQFVLGDAADAEEARASLARYEANDRVLRERWPDLLAAHPGKWAAVFNGGTTVIRDGLQELIEAVPAESLPTAVVRLVVEDRPRLL